MASTVDESDLDPAKFLQSVRELSDKREREDLERYRKLEEEIAQGRQLRLERKLERARSISPTKDSRASTPSVAGSRTATPVNAGDRGSPAAAVSPASATTRDAARSDSYEQLTGAPMDSPRNPADAVPKFKGFKPSARPRESTERPESPTKSSPSAALPQRAGTLSWQRRPTSSSGKSRPLSMVATENALRTPRETSDTAHIESQEKERSRDQIAASLGSKDPSWFKQTAERGIGSAAYRRNADETPSKDETLSNRRHLPGLSREPAAELQKPQSPEPESAKSTSPSRAESVRGSSTWSSRFSANTSSSSDYSRPESGSALPSSESRKLPPRPTSDHDSSTDLDQPSLGRTPSMSASQARLAGGEDRPSSPTKGMGGFVQSAMLKRSDSVNKRWSAQPGPSLSRQNSAASVRSGFGSVRGMGGLPDSKSMPKLASLAGSRETSEEPRSRPSSSHSNLSNLTLTQSAETKDVFVKPALPHHSRSKSVASTYSNSMGEGGKDTSAASPPSSPSKRWSPTKSSWLENALNKPESPKPSLAQPLQPSWMAEISKAKQQRTSADSTPRTGTPNPAETELRKSPVKTPVAFGPSMLKRSQSKDLRSEDPITRSITPPTKAKPASLVGKPASALSDTMPKQSPTNKVAEKKAPVEAKVSENLAESSKDTTVPPSDLPEDIEPKDNPSLSSPSSSTMKPKPETPPKKDFRGTLKSRPLPGAKPKEEPEFRAVFGKLKPTQTGKYVAPDELKNNITRGKAGLAVTGGPQKTPRRDELKESLLAKKEEMKAKATDPEVSHSRQASGAPQTPTKPEALALREKLGSKTDNSTVRQKPEEPKKSETPEALTRHRSLKDKPKFEPLEKLTSAPGRVESREPNETSKLAARFNPALAGILARGPPLASDVSKDLNSATPPTMSSSAVRSTDNSSEQPADAAQLSDVRKGRAKGPKRRKPNAKESEQDVQVEKRTSSPQLVKPKDVLPSSPATKMPLQPAPKSPAVRAVSYGTAAQKADKEKPLTPTKPSFTALTTPTVQSAEEQNTQKPIAPAKSPLISAKLAPSDQLHDTTAPAPKPEFTSPGVKSTDSVRTLRGFGSVNKPKPSEPADADKENTNGAVRSVKNAASFWGRQATPQSVEVPRSRSPIKLPTKKDEEAAMKSAGLLASSPARPISKNGLGLGITSEKDSAQNTPSIELPLSPPLTAGLPPKPAKPSRIVSGSLQESSPNKGSSPKQADSEAHRQLRDLFGDIPTSSRKLDLDTQALLTSTATSPSKVKTLRKSVQEITAVGNLLSMPAQEEYILYADATYICTHISGTAAGGKSVEAFLWVGANVQDADAPELQATAKKVARVAGAELQLVRQYREPSSFLQALGGIIVTRRSREKMYVLRGRKHLRHLAFDEVEFGVSSLCSGFPYLVSFPVTLQETKLYLWKGTACSAEELGSARLVGMELNTSDELIEVDEGAEFASFLKIFGQGTSKSSVPACTNVWRAKANAANKWSTRLFRIEPAAAKVGLFTSFLGRRPSWQGRSPSRPESETKYTAREIMPFALDDLEPEGVYLLDAYAELYMLLGPLLPSQEHHSALLAQVLLLASDYAILSASLEDRPSIPKCHVLFSGVPRDLKLHFRHWDERRGLWGTGGLMAGSGSQRGLKGESEAVTLPLDDVVAVVCER